MSEIAPAPPDLDALTDRVAAAGAFVAAAARGRRPRRRGAADDGRAPAHRPAHGRPRAPRGRARAGQDARRVARSPAPSTRASSASSSRRTCSRPTSSGRSSTTRARATSSSRRGPSSPTSSSPTRSTAPRPRCSPRSSRRCRSGRSRSARRPTRCRDPFLVLATQNPVEQEGTYPLPEAQVDRFMLKTVVTYPTRDEELLIMRRMAQTAAAPEVAPVVTPAEVRAARAVVGQIYVDPRVEEYVVDLVLATREPERYGLADAGRAHRLRREPARLDRARPRRARPRLPARPRLRHARRRPRRRARRAAPPRRGDLRGRGRGGHRPSRSSAASSTPSTCRRAGWSGRVRGRVLRHSPATRASRP